MRSAPRQAPRGPVAVVAARGFTLLELIVVLVILAALFALLMPAMQSMRELSRRRNCEHRLIQLSLAIANYSNQHEHYPIGTINPTGPIKSTPSGFHHNWIEGLLPLLDAEEAYQAINRNVSVYHPANDPVRMMMMPQLRCPSADGVRENTSCYAGIHASSETPIDFENDGTFVLNRWIRPRDIADGLSYTIFVGEKVSPPELDLGWLSGTRSSLRNAGHALEAGAAVTPPAAAVDAPVDPLYVGGLASQHVGGVFLLKGSGECDFRSPTMDVKLLQQMASRAGSESAGEELPEVATQDAEGEDAEGEDAGGEDAGGGQAEPDGGPLEDERPQEPAADAALRSQSGGAGA